MYKIMLVEDDEVIAGAILDYLRKWGFAAFSAQDFFRVIEEFVEQEPSMVLIDVTLPCFNGYHWCSEIRKISKVPIVFLSSASENMNIVMAMNMGADDYIVKPFDLSVLAAKIQALLRRSYTYKDSSNLIEIQGLLLNLSDASVIYQGEKLSLTKNEFKILQLLMENAGKIVSRDALMIRLWESDSFIDDNTLTVNIARLRKHLADLGLENFIQTKKGIGYVIPDGGASM